jgi:hypothetical protein
VRLVADDKLHDELCAVRLSTKAERETYYLERKELVKQRLGRSPDRADATCLARYAGLLDKIHNKPKLIMSYGKPRDYGKFY